MPIQDDIDSSAQQIADLVDKAKAELIAGLYEIGVDVDDVNALANALLTIDIEGTLKSKIQKATAIYAQAHRQVLESTIGFADINPASLTLESVNSCCLNFKATPLAAVVPSTNDIGR